MLDPDRPRLPDFVIGGAPKCGTTALFSYLDQHPDVFTTTPKEPHYFASAPLGRRVMQGDYSRGEYEALFAGRRPHQVAGEGSTHYLHYAATVAPALAEVVPRVRLVFSLRDPVERAYSHYCFRYSVAGPYDAGGVGSRETFADFARDPEIARIGDYASNLATFYEHFDREQVLVLLMRDLRRDLQGTMRQICEHVGVDSEFSFDLGSRENETVYPRFPALMPLADRAVSLVYGRLDSQRRIALLRTRRRWLFSSEASKPPMDPRDRADVAELYHTSTRQLAELIGRDLSGWTSQ